MGNITAPKLPNTTYGLFTLFKMLSLTMWQTSLCLKKLQGVVGNGTVAWQCIREILFPSLVSCCVHFFFFWWKLHVISRQKQGLHRLEWKLVIKSLQRNVTRGWGSPGTLEDWRMRVLGTTLGSASVITSFRGSETQSWSFKTTLPDRKQYKPQRWASLWI